MKWGIICFTVCLGILGWAVGCGLDRENDFGYGNYYRPYGNIDHRHQWTGILSLPNGSKSYNTFLKETGICGVLASGFFCKAIDAAPYATLFLPLERALGNPLGSGTLGQLHLTTKNNSNSIHVQGSPVTIEGFFRQTDEGVIRADNMYGQTSRNLFNETIIDVVGDPTSGRIHLTMYYKGLFPEHRILEGTLFRGRGAGFPPLHWASF